MNIDSAVPGEQETDREHLAKDEEKAEEKENGQQQEVADVAASEKQPNQQNYAKRTDTGNKGSNEKQNQ
jgi:predicted phage gp36 major capsid-like protein